MVVLAGIGGGSLVSQVALDRVAVASNVLARPAQSVTAADLVTQQTAFQQIYTKVNPSVVNIQVIEQAATTATGRRNPLGNAPQSQAPAMALGSGFVWNKQGDIVTNNHVVNGASRITVTFADGTTVDAKLVGVDPDSDLAVINVSVPAEKLVPVESRRGRYRHRHWQSLWAGRYNDPGHRQRTGADAPGRLRYEREPDGRRL
jgi:S1-C subfamily serine protease